jgi:hypothetical protein
MFCRPGCQYSTLASLDPLFSAPSRRTLNRATEYLPKSPHSSGTPRLHPNSRLHKLPEPRRVCAGHRRWCGALSCARMAGGWYFSIPQRRQTTSMSCILLYTVGHTDPKRPHYSTNDGSTPDGGVKVLLGMSRFQCCACRLRQCQCHRELTEPRCYSESLSPHQAPL